MNMSSKTMGILAIAALFGIVAFFVSLGVLDFHGFTSFIIGVIVAIITWVVLWLGWGDDTTAQSGLGTDTGWTGTNAAKTTATPAKSTTSASAAPAANLASGSPEPDASEAKSATQDDTAKPKTATGSAAGTTSAKASAHAVNAAPAARSAPGAKPASAAKSAPKEKAAPAAKAAKPAPKNAPSTKTAPVSKTAPAQKAAAEETAASGETKPETLSSARDGKADDLKKIKGVGPGLEKTLNEMGFYHFDQIAAWSTSEVEWVDSRLKFKGRIVRDEWIKQATGFAKG